MQATIRDAMTVERSGAEHTARVVMACSTTSQHTKRPQAERLLKATPATLASARQPTSSFWLNLVGG
jgi:hypothetical protein